MGGSAAATGFCRFRRELTTSGEVSGVNLCAREISKLGPKRLPNPYLVKRG
jgi:hypothetical protein